MAWPTDLNILYEDRQIIVVEKPCNVPTNSDASGDNNLLDYLKAYIKERDKKPGNVYLGLLQRLDRPVGGLAVFAKTSKAASRLSEQLRQQTIERNYLAVVAGKTSPCGAFQDTLAKDHVKNFVSVASEGKLALLNYERLAYLPDYSLVKITLVTGRSHQIRVQFSYHGHPLWGDQKYNKQAKKGQQLALFASGLSFQHPITKETLSFSLSPQFPPFDQFTY